MSIDLFGLKIKIEHILIAVVLYFVISSFLVCSCSRVNSIQEGMAVLGADVSYKMGDGVTSSWENKQTEQGPSVSFRSQNHDAYQSEMVTPDQSMDFFANTEFSQDCCGASYSGFGGLLSNGGATSGGCACLNKKQMDYINQRGGNRTLTTEY